MLDKNKLAREELVRKPEIATKGKRSWLFKVLLMIIVAVVVYYLITHQEVIMNPVNEFFSKFGG